jgi:hypothetical protein
MNVGRSPLCCGRLVLGWEHGRVFAVGSCHHPGRPVLPLCQVCDGGKRPRDQEGLPVTNAAEVAKDSGGADGAGGGAGPGPGAACTTSASASAGEVVEDEDREWLGAIQPSTKRPARPCTVCGVAASKYAGSGFPPPARQHASTSMPSCHHAAYATILRAVTASPFVFDGGGVYQRTRSCGLLQPRFPAAAVTPWAPVPTQVHVPSLFNSNVLTGLRQAAQG